MTGRCHSNPRQHPGTAQDRRTLHRIQGRASAVVSSDRWRAGIWSMARASQSAQLRAPAPTIDVSQEPPDRHRPDFEIAYLAAEEDSNNPPLIDRNDVRQRKRVRSRSDGVVQGILGRCNAVQTSLHLKNCQAKQKGRPLCGGAESNIFVTTDPPLGLQRTDLR